LSITKRLNNITHIPKGRLLEAPPVPRSVKIELTAKCNYKCKYCSIGYRKEKPQDMEWSLFTDIAGRLKDLGVEEVGVFYVGESFVNPQLLVKAIKYLKDLKFSYVFLTSNASLADPEHVRACMSAGLDSLKWSCNAADDAQFKELMGVSAKLYQKAKDNIKAAWIIRSEGYKTGLFASSILYNDGQPRRAIKFLENHVYPYVDQFYWLPLYTAGGQAKNVQRELGFHPIAGNTGRLANPADPLPCWTLFTEAHIMADGRMTGCCLDSNGKWVMGDLKKQKFMEIWHSEEFRNLRKAHLKKNVLGTVCQECALF
jgi:radical SAM protein with 4Fe4S-binding SPASM domain